MSNPYVLACGIAVAILVFAEVRNVAALRALAKVTASTVFCLLAWDLADLAGAYDRLVLGALVACWLGDVLLLSSRQSLFLGGLGAFLLGHVGFAAAFATEGFSPTWFAVAAVVLALVARAVWAWLGPHVSRGMKAPVLAYIAVITVMVSTAVSATARGGSSLILVGAVAFFVSDLAVARDRFVAPGWPNRLWGLPLYYGAQLCLATTLA